MFHKIIRLLIHIIHQFSLVFNTLISTVFQLCTHLFIIPERTTCNTRHLAKSVFFLGPSFQRSHYSTIEVFFSLYTIPCPRFTRIAHALTNRSTCEYSPP